MATLAKYPTGTSVTIPWLTGQDIDVQGSGTFLKFYGHPDPVGVRSEHNPVRSWACEASFPRNEYPDAEALIVLLADAFKSADARLLLTPDVMEGTAQDTSLNRPAVVEIHSWSISRQAAMVTVSFTATRVRSD